MPPILFTTETAVSRAPQVSSADLINCFVERQAPEAKSTAPIFAAPGLTAFGTAGTGANRGSWLFAGVAYFVQGSELWQMAADATPTRVGTGIAGAGRVSMSDNGVQLCIVNGAQGYIFTTGGGLVQITAAAFYPANTVAFMDGYFIFDRKGTNEWFLSALYDGLSYNALDFASAESFPGNVVATAQNLQLLFIFCADHIELWYDAGAADFPFQRYAGGVLSYGCAAPLSVIDQDGALFFLGADKVFYRLQANAPIRISTHYIEPIIAADPDLSQATTDTFTLEGHKLIQVNLVASRRTLFFDISTGRWHKRLSWLNNNDGSITELTYWRAQAALAAYGKTLVGDTVAGQIGYVDWSQFTEYGNTMPMILRSGPQHQDRRPLFVSRFELDMEVGVGNPVDPGSNPQAMMRYSRDGGQTWSLQQLWRSMGKIGQYATRLRWLSLGRGFQWNFEITITDPVFRTVIAAHMDAEIGDT